MSELFENVIAIERGDMSEDDWHSMQKMALLYKGRLVAERVVEQGIDEAAAPDDIAE